LRVGESEDVGEFAGRREGVLQWELGRVNESEQGGVPGGACAEEVQFLQRRKVWFGLILSLLKFCLILIN